MTDPFVRELDGTPPSSTEDELAQNIVTGPNQVATAEHPAAKDLLYGTYRPVDVPKSEVETAQSSPDEASETVPALVTEGPDTPRVTAAALGDKVVDVVDSTADVQVSASDPTPGLKQGDAKPRSGRK